ncbi:MAG: HipA domain-containing protein [Proteobacteria bacterium]|jgi:serine/threonine-protein kinase HipA|nr:HipA domain-containing protein [Burkholderiaceae bacterium]MCH8855879.1 HipA domain-containing protein [Pseudomonadota bacterium]|mmetsp:Transcript_59150/g.139317  ORF Transcript_59150/g.139317 Transcript_59150/m.139317 type:complete len:456 (-) Transcript_59150:5822-7189(-)
MAGRPSHAKALSLWMNGLRVGEWRIPTRGPMELAYDPAWLVAPEARPLSLSLPLPLHPVPLTTPAVGHYFSNLLPDHEPIRRRIASRFRLADTAPFSLLAEVGRDCVGALQLLPVDAAAPDVKRIDAEPLDEAEIEQALDRAVTPTGGMAATADEEAEFRISIAGAQDKTALLWHDGHWCRPLGATPTTHLFKLPLGLIGGQSRQINFKTSVDNEWLCLRLLGLYGLPVPRTHIASFGRHRPLIVERFDRRFMPPEGRGGSAWWARLPQEDFCQVFGLPPTAKYERDGGPGIADIAARLRLSVNPNAEADLDNFLSAQILFWMLAAIDGHAKNFSLHLLPQGRYRLTPFYDVLSAWPAAGKAPSQINPHDAKLAMSLRGKQKHCKLFEIQRRHFDSTAQLCGLESAGLLIERILARTPEVIHAAQRGLPAGFPQQVLDRTLQGLGDMAARLGAGA